ncbi:outer dense fiber protein 2 isoform X1 [Boleophthalmus pectinirostris]|uniref:outer dense fiber protein 2 isoform X1 n=1 Tax=Boleophthalmus pectinirostris TaxID=150288 RepID=UPI00242C6AAD|nr:outer dense fiber protein 2 isoform X1 [Boleophthalmus pectinirostris]
MKNRSNSPLIHVHVSKSTPVHVHLKSQKSPTETPQGKIKQEKGTLRSTAKVKTRVPWIPPRKTTLRDASLKFEGPTHYLEIIPQSTQEPEELQSALCLADLTADEDEIHGRINRYEQKIDSLMTEVSSLKNEVELKKKEQQLQRQSEQLSLSQRVVAEQEEELAVVAKKLQQTEQENTLLRCSIENMSVESASDGSYLPEKDALLTKLIEAEVDGRAASKQVATLSECVCKMSATSGGRLSSYESSHLAHHKELLLQKLETFEATNRVLRQLLREHQKSHMDSAQVSAQKETLLKKLSYIEAENANLVIKLQDTQNQVYDLCKALDNEKVNAKSVSDFSKSLESTRGHLQGQLHSKEAENNRLTVQIKNLEHSGNEQKTEMEHLTLQLMRLKQQTVADKETLKRVAKAQKQRAERCEDTTAQLQLQLLKMENQVIEALSAAETWKKCHKEDVKDKTQLELEISSLNSRIMELSEQLKGAEDKRRADRDSLVEHLHGLTSEGTAAKLENQSLKATVSTLEEKLSLSQTELQHVKSTIKQYERLIDSYKIQVGKTRAEVDEYCAHLAKAEQDALTVREELDQEVQQVRRDLLRKLAELEPLPEALCHTELKLQEAQERELHQEMCRKELETTINELHLKVESEGNQAELLKQKNKTLLEENRKLQHNVEFVERKLEEATNQNSELLTVVAKWENSLHCNQLRLEEKNRECSLLNQKLEEALNDAQQQVSGIKECAANKERATQSKILELETQLGRTTSEIHQLRHTKEETEQRYQSRLQDVKDRLEQSDSTNRSLQNYVQFLKASYTNVFGDLSLSNSFCAPPV